jgi:capsular polysaccharide biosynthesis protein
VDTKSRGPREAEVEREPSHWALAEEFEPLPRIGVAAALRRYWMLALLPVLVLVPVVGVVAAKRQPKYSAEARLIVGRLNLSTPGAVSGFAQAAQDLASTYPLVIYADGVIGPITRELHMRKGAVRSELTATSVPGTSIVRVDATGTSARQAIDLANAASSALVSYLASFTKSDPDAARLRRRLQAANLAYERATVLVPSASGKSLDATGQQLKANADTARDSVAALNSAFQQAVLNESVSSLLQPVTSASSATSDRSSKLQIALLAALLAGAIIGVALATLRANMVARRALAAPSWQPTIGVPPGNGDLANKPRPLRTPSRWRARSGPPNGS